MGGRVQGDKRLDTRLLPVATICSISMKSEAVTGLEA